MKITKCWMSQKQRLQEQKAIDILNDSSLTKREKAFKLGYRYENVYIDGKRKKGYVSGFDLFLKVKKLLDHHKKFPLGFDFYYWGSESYKEQVNEDN